MDFLEKQPSTVAVPKSLLRVVWILLLVGVGVVADMVCRPLEGRVLERPCASNQEPSFDPIGASEATVGHQTMVTHRNAQSGHDIQQPEHGPVQPCVAVKDREGGDSDQCAQCYEAENYHGHIIRVSSSKSC